MRLFAFIVLILCSLAQAADTGGELQKISVTIRAGRAQGSGTLVARELPNGDTISFVWTAGHVIDELRRVRKSDKDGKALVEFDDPEVVQEYYENGRRVGESAFVARVLKYSEAEAEDLALLMVRKLNYSRESARFYLEETIPPPGTELYHVGSLLGQIGSNSLTTGIISQTGRVLTFRGRGVVFDQTTVTAFPGSSGGGVFLRSDGRYVGMLVRGAGEQFNLIVPIRRMREWANAQGILWSLDPSVPLPSLSELNSISPE